MKRTRVTRHINHTGRRKIERSHVSISIFERQDEPRTFSADLQLGQLEVPDNSPVYVEAYYKSSSQRFDFGTVGNLQVPSSTTLDQIDLGGQILFRVKVVDSTSKIGRLLAAAEKIAPKSESDDESRAYLVKVLASDIGDEIWKMEMSTDMRPRLILNNKIPNVINEIRTNPMFQCLILPAVIRDVLTYLFWDEDGHIDEETWQGQFVAYCQSLAGADVPDEKDPLELRSWTEDVVAGFSANFKLRQRLVDRLMDVPS